MAYVAIILAVLALIGAGVLWYLGSKAEAPANAGLTTTPAPETEQPPVEEPALDDTPELMLELPPEETVEEPEELVVEEPFEPVDDSPEPAPELEAEPEPEPEPELVAEPEAQSEAEAEPAPLIAPAPRPHRKSGLQLPGSTRREKRAWAEENGYEFVRTDEYLVDEWSRGAAATGAAARDIVSGSIYGHEMLLMDLGGTNVMAMRTGTVSDVVVDMRRTGFSAVSSDDLLEVFTIAGFTVFATEVGPADRMIDERVVTALQNLPKVVSAVWFESDWVLAQTERGSVPADWDDMLAPLGLLADAARVLPPQTWQTLEFTEPTREMGEPISLPAPEVEIEEEATGVQVVRPEEPLEMPTRITGALRGVMDHHQIGGDEVDAIADGADEPAPNDGTRVTREKKPPSIFGD
ncbi:hypothetical protein QP027_10010 [Corynebacterium breve]|uniref:Secreted or membrane protein n=1 Tax=Corynebacterium breve TaxID=3049799 RepID=A0ABY8VCQ8_9CORY|nr:hypothetical protein [Corynebacterium breve]WIM67426.1 hypothetical protein QP027_10010 [Corynebacterium breve]